MKPLFKTLCITIFSLFLIFQIASAEESIPEKTTIGIEQLMNNADQYTDRIIVQGIVSKVFPQDNLIGLIDSPNTLEDDIKKCTQSSSEASAKTCSIKAAKDCAKPCSENAGKTCSNTGYTLTLPVQWDGDMPEPATKVCVAGKITHKDGRLLFVAESINVMSN